MSMTEEHTRFMQSALDMAGEALAAGEVPVGCIFVRDGEIIAKARNRTNELRNATRHAELEAIDQILADASLTPTRTPYALSTTTLYVTVEPCIMCASALRQMGIKEVFYGCANERFGGCEGVLPVNQLQHPAHPAYRATGGFLREEAIMILRRFYITENTKAPVPKSKANRVLKTDIQPLANPSEGKTARVALPGSSSFPPRPSPFPPSSPEPEEPGAQIVDEEQDPLADLDDSTTDIDLVHCRLNALPPSLARFKGLTRLCVRQNQLTAVPPELFSDDGTLEELDCYDNKLTNDGIDGALRAPQMKNLKVLDLSFNLIKKLPEPLGDLAQLEVVYFVQNKISQIDARLGACQRLRSLELGGNRIRELSGLPSLPALEELWLGKNKLTSLLTLGAIELPRLRILSLQSNRITKIEGIPPSVEELYLSHNGVEKIEGLEQCTKLNTLDVGNNFITKVEGVAHLGETLEEFWVNGNKLSPLGEVLVAMEVLKKLKTVYLEANPCQAEEGANYRRKIMLSLPWVEKIDATYVRR